MRKLFSNRWFHTLILFFLLGMAIWIRTYDHHWAQSLRFLAFDTYNQIHPREPTDQVVIVDIDEMSLGREDLGQWPWSRLTIAKLVENLENLGAKAIVFDVVFAEADRTSPQSILQRLPDRAEHQSMRSVLEAMPDNDTVLAQAIEEAGNVVTAFIWTSSREATRRKPELSQPILTRKPADTLIDTVPRMSGVATNLAVLSQAAAGNGSFGVVPEVDGIIRRVPLLFSFEEADAGQRTLYPSLALEALRVAQNPKLLTKIRPLTTEELGPFDAPLLLNIGDYEVPLDWDGKFFVYFSEERQDKYIPAWEVIDGAVDQSRIDGKIVFVGTSAEGLKDLRSTPLDLFIPGVELHVNVVEQVLAGEYLHRPLILEGVELLSIGIVGLIIILLAPFVGAVVTALFTLTLIAVITFVSWYSFETLGLLLDPVYPSLSILVLFIASALLTYIRTEAERKQVRQAFGLYISPDFMKELTKDPDKLRLGGETRELTVMFSDIRNFTSIAESMSSKELIQLMNDFLTPMSDLVMNNRGTIDKYMGDAMMAFWNAPLDDPDHARHACIAALQMNTALVPINEELKIKAKEQGREPALLKAGIGISTGPAAVGNMGSKQRFAYSVLGDTVNLASRLEGQTKYYNASIMISEVTKNAVPDFAALELDLLRVKGKQETVRVYGLLGDAEYAAPESFKKWEKLHEEMLRLYRSKKFEDAQKSLQKCLELSEPRLRGFYALYEERIAALIETPPPEDWDGVFVATSK